MKLFQHIFIASLVTFLSAPVALAAPIDNCIILASGQEDTRYKEYYIPLWKINFHAALDACKSAINHEDPQEIARAHFNLSRVYSSQKDIKNSMDHLRASYDLNFVPAKVGMAEFLMLMNGDVKSKNTTEFKVAWSEAIEMLEEAQQVGNAYAAYRLSNIFWEDHFGFKNNEKAYEHAKYAYQNGIIQASFILSLHYAKMDDCENTYKMAIEGAEMNNDESVLFLSNLAYENVNNKKCSLYSPQKANVILDNILKSKDTSPENRFLKVWAKYKKAINFGENGIYSNSLEILKQIHQRIKLDEVAEIVALIEDKNYFRADTRQEIIDRYTLEVRVAKFFNQTYHQFVLKSREL